MSEKYKEAYNLLRKYCFENEYLRLLILYPDRIHEECEKLMRIYKYFHAKDNASGNIVIRERLVLMIRMNDIEGYAKTDFGMFRMHLLNFLMNRSSPFDCCFLVASNRNKHGKYCQLKEEMIEMKSQNDMNEINCIPYSYYYKYHVCKNVDKRMYAIDIALCPPFDEEVMFRCFYISIVLK